MKIKTSELKGRALDYAVATITKAGIVSLDLTHLRDVSGKVYAPSTDPAQAWPIIEREDINVNRYTHSEVTESGQEIYRKDGWTAFTTATAYWMTPKRAYGPTSLIAAMRCYVASELGGEVDVPEELLT